MKIINTRYDKNTTRTAQVCVACHYIYETIFDATPGVLEEAICLGGSDNGDKPFIKLLEKQLYTDDYNKIQTVNLYACPRCMTVQLCEQEVYD